MRLFPYTLIRLGGDSFNKIEILESQKTLGVVKKFINERANLHIEKLKLCELLFEYIKISDNRKTQNILQNFRRDLFNERTITLDRLEEITPLLHSELRSVLTSYLDSYAQKNQRFEEISRIFKNEISEERCSLQKISNSSVLKKGLLLSSKTFLDALTIYQKNLPNSFGKKEEQIELTLLKYVARIHAKTSPFSTFTNLSIGRLADLDKVFFKLSDKNYFGEKVKSHIRLNNVLLKLLLKVFRREKSIYLNTYLKLNPTVSSNSLSYRFLINKDNIESFQEIKTNSVVQLVYSKLISLKGGIRFKDLITDCLNHIEGDFNKIEEYIYKLIKLGFIEFQFNTSAMDSDWDKALIRNLLEIKDDAPIVSEIIDVLTELEKSAIDYGNASVIDREEILKKAYLEFSDLYLKLHKSAGLPESERLLHESIDSVVKQKQEIIKKKQGLPENKIFEDAESTEMNITLEQLFYEDTTRFVDAECDTKSVTELVKLVNSLQEELGIFALHEDEKDRMRDFFIRTYGQDGSISLLNFYEDFSREDLANKDLVNKNGDVPRINERSIRKKNWRKKVAEYISHELNINEININLDVLRKINSEVGTKKDNNSSNSYGCFLQMFTTDEGKLSAVINATFAGYGKLASRFLHLFDKTVLEETRKYNNDLKADNEIFVENCDASINNANMHPALMPYEIWMPGSQNNGSFQDRLSITEFSLSLVDDELVLKHVPSDKLAYFFDLGFQGTGRSKLFQMLDFFSKAKIVSYSPLVEIINSEVENTFFREREKKIVVYPRITFEVNLVLQRKTWAIPKELIPIKLQNENPLEYFIKITDWRIKNLIPEEIYVYLYVPSQMKSVDPSLLRRITRDDYKPQYINFKSLLYVSLFEKIMKKAAPTIKIQEMYPTSSHLINIDMDKYFMEFLVQWYT